MPVDQQRMLGERSGVQGLMKYLLLLPFKYLELLASANFINPLLLTAREFLLFSYTMFLYCFIF